jgi:hypothetical protein
MSIRSTLIVASAIATLGIQVGPACAAESFTPGTGDKKPAYYGTDGSMQGRPPQLPAPATPAQQNDWLLGGSNH